MKIVVLDGYGMNSSDLSWNKLKKIGDVTMYDRTVPSVVINRSVCTDIGTLTNVVN